MIFPWLLLRSDLLFLYLSFYGGASQLIA